MSTPRSLTLPPCVRRTDIETGRGPFAALEALPTTGVTERSPALLVPGLPGSKEDFLAVLQTLAGAGRRVVAVDMRGQYETPGPADPAAYDRATLGADIAALVEALTAGGLHLVGHSFGGLVTRETVLTDGSALVSYSLMSTGPGAITGRRETEGRQLLAMLPEVGLEYIWTHVMRPDAEAAGTPPEVVAFLRERIFRSSPTGLVAMAEQALLCPDRVAELAKLDIPMLVLYGEHDDGWPPEVQADLAGRLGAGRVCIPGAAHSPAVEAPETTASALTEFWNKSEVPGGGPFH